MLSIEVRRLWRNKLGRAGLAVAVVIPLLYSTLYLWAFWNPYGSLNKLPVALVNEDTGGQLDNKQVNFGHNMAQSLEDARDLDWHAVNNADAEYGLHHDKYYMVLRIPPTFTSDLLSVNTNHPHQANLDFVPNQGRNYLAGQIVKRVQDEIAVNVAQQFSQQYIRRLLDVVGQANNGLSTIAETANQLASGGNHLKQGALALHSGIQGANQGAASLQSGLNQLVPGSKQLADGLKQTQAGTVSVQQGVTQAADGVTSIRSQLSPFVGPTGQVASGMNDATQAARQLNQASQQAQSGLTQAITGSTQVQNGVSSSQSAVHPLQDGVNQAVASLQNYQASFGTSADPRVVQAIGTLQQLLPGFANLSGGLTQTQQGATSLTNSLNDLQTGQSQVTSGLGTLSSQLGTAAHSTQQLAASFGQLDGGLATIQSGMKQASTALGQLGTSQASLQSGASQLNNGLVASQTAATQLTTGLSQLNQGSQQLVTGTTKLADGQQQFADKVSEAHSLGQIQNPSLIARLMSNPIYANSNPLYPSSLYGPGLAPYFVPLSLWVGALMLYFLISFREGRWRIMPVSGSGVVLGKFGVLWGIGVLQALVASTVLLYGLGLSVTSVSAFYLFNIALSITYITIIGMFIGVLGSGPGRFIAIVLLLLQLTSGGGTFPIELVPGFFQAIHSWLPMTYGITGLRDLIAIGDTHQLWQMIGVTALYFAGSLTIFLATRRYHLRPKNLRAPDQLVS